MFGNPERMEDWEAIDNEVTRRNFSEPGKHKTE
jgi:hypothetical protein